MIGGGDTVGGDGSESGTVTEEEGKKQNRRRVTMSTPPLTSVRKRRATPTYMACSNIVHIVNC